MKKQNNDTSHTVPALLPPLWTVCYNIVSHESDAWVGTGWEFFDDEKEAQVCYERQQRLGNVPTKRPFYDSVDYEHLGVVDQKRLNTRRAAVAGPRVDRALYSELIHIAAELARGSGFLSTCAEDLNPRLKRADILRTAEAQEERLKDWAYRVRQVANKLSITPPTPTESESCSHWREGDSDNCPLCGVDLGPTTEADGAAPPEITREIFDAGFAATSPAERSTWNEVLSEFADTAIKCHIGFKHDGPWDECKWVECEDRRKLIQRANAAAPADNDAESVALIIPTCGECPFVDHSGVFTEGGARAICGHRNAPDTFAAIVEGDDHWHWKHRQVDREAAPPAQCPLRTTTTKGDR